jgi:aminopeptidase
VTTSPSSRTNELTSSLAELAVRVGANVAPGQDVVVLAFALEHAPLARAVADAAYRAGAHYVTVLYWDQHVKRSRLRHADAESLGFIPAWWDRHIEEAIGRRSAYIILWGDPEPDLLADIDPRRAGADHMPLTGALHAMVGGGEVNWTFVPAPSSGAAARILGTDDVDALWEVMTPILRLDGDDPPAAWQRHIERLEKRAQALAGAEFVRLRFHGGGTDLEVGLMEGAHWLSGGITTSWGRRTVVNMPTEEVFTTPDNRHARGTVVATRPLRIIGGVTVEGLRLRFEDGRVAEVEADRNAETFRSYLASDAGAARLGEVALVDGASGRPQRPGVQRHPARRERHLPHRAGQCLPVHRPGPARRPATARDAGLQPLRHPPGHHDRRPGGRRRRHRPRGRDDPDPARRRLGTQPALSVSLVHGDCGSGG